MIVVEKHPTNSRLFRFSCPRCGETGAWHPSLADAEASSARHRKVRHAEAANA
jgi:hypothetical protein